LCPPFWTGHSKVSFEEKLKWRICFKWENANAYDNHYDLEEKRAQMGRELKKIKTFIFQEEKLGLTLFFFSLFLKIDIFFPPL
jgi:hypothetical protein